MNSAEVNVKAAEAKLKAQKPTSYQLVKHMITKCKKCDDAVIKHVKFIMHQSSVPPLTYEYVIKSVEDFMQKHKINDQTDTILIVRLALIIDGVQDITDNVMGICNSLRRLIELSAHDSIRKTLASIVKWAETTDGGSDNKELSVLNGLITNVTVYDEQLVEMLSDLCSVIIYQSKTSAELKFDGEN